MKRKYAIVNDVDQPYRRLVTEIIDGKHFYMTREEEPQLKQYDGMTPERPAFLEDFGFVIKEVEGTNRIRFTKVNPSIVTYKDGKPRQWQGTNEFELPRVALTESQKKKFKIKDDTLE